MPVTLSSRSPLVTPTALFRALLCLPALAFAQPAQADDSPWSGLAPGSHLAVTTTTGRVLLGQLDARTSPHRLWLTAEAEGMTISSLITRGEVLGIAAAEPFALPPRLEAPSGAIQPPAAPPISANSRRPAVVRSLTVFAQLANWNGDAEPDGLRVWIQPRAANGAPVAAGGGVTVRLAVFRGDWRGSRGGFRVEEEWFREISAEAAGEAGAVLELPFEKIRPETDRELLSLGVVSVRLSVAGQGTFDAQVEDVSLRSQAFTRDLRLRSQASDQR